jgi:hypothetical protein
VWIGSGDQKAESDAYEQRPEPPDAVFRSNGERIAVTFDLPATVFSHPHASPSNTAAP